MVDKLTYVSSYNVNEKVEFGEYPIYANSSDIRDYEWNYITQFNKVKKFNKSGVITKTLPVLVVDKNNLDFIVEIFEKDIILGNPGKLYVGNYYILCNIYKITKENYLNNGYISLNLGIVLDNKNWIKETVTKFYSSATELNDEMPTKDYNYGYNYDYVNTGFNSDSVTNNSYSPADFKIIINGYVDNPVIQIGSNIYQVNTTIEDGGRLEIDSTNKTIKNINKYGQELNAFMYRDIENYIFEKIPVGTNTVSWSGSMEFTITVFEVRSEPKWS